MNNTTERSNILLVVCGIDAPAGATSRITVSFLQELFEQFGTLYKIIIFLREAIVKAFLEFATPEEAAAARAFLHGCTYNNFGRIKVFFSAMQRLEFSSRFVECKDLNPNKSQGQAKLTRMATHKAKVIVSETMSNQKTAAAIALKAKTKSEKKGLSLRPDFNNAPVARMNSEVLTNTECSQVAVAEDATSECRERLQSIDAVCVEDPLLTPLPTADTFREFGCDDMAPPSLAHLPAPTLLSLPSEFTTTDAALAPASKLGSQSELKPPSAADLKPEAQVSKVVLISNLEEFFFTASEIFNLFSCFGNIVRVLLMKNLKKAMVEYKKAESAEVAVNCMNNRSFGRTKLKVVFSKYKKIDLKRNNKSENSQNFNEVIIVSNKMNRFKNSAPHVIAPTDTLLVVVEKAADLQLSDVMLRMQLLAKPTKMKTLAEEKENTDVALHQVVFKFSSVMAAMKVLAQAHNSEVSGHFLSVTFAAPTAVGA